MAPRICAAGGAKEARPMGASLHQITLGILLLEFLAVLFAVRRLVRDLLDKVIVDGEDNGPIHLHDQSSVLVEQARVGKDVRPSIKRVPVRGPDSRRWDFHVVASEAPLLDRLRIGPCGSKEGSGDRMSCPPVC